MTARIVYDISAIVLLALHLICMNLSGGLPVLAAWLHRQGNRKEKGASDPAMEQVARDAIWQALVMLFVGIGLGFGLAGVMWLDNDRGLFEIFPAFAYKIYWGLAELVFYVACLGIYLSLATDRFRESSVASGFRYLLAILAATNLLYHFPPLFAVMSRSAQSPQAFSHVVYASQFRLLLLQDQVMPLMLHVYLAVLAVAPISTPSKLPPTDASPPPPPQRMMAAKRLMGISLIATLAQLPVGVWLLMRFDAVGQSRLMGSDLAGTICLGLSVLLAFRLMHQMASATFGSPTRHESRQVGTTLLLIILLMTAALRRAEEPRRLPPNPATTSAVASTSPCLV